MSYLFAVIMIVMYIASYMYTYMYIAGCFGLFVGEVSQTLPANVDQHRICMTMIRLYMDSTFLPQFKLLGTFYPNISMAVLNFLSCFCGYFNRGVYF